MIISVKQLHCHNQRKLLLNGPSRPSVGPNDHSSLSHCVTEALNPLFVLHITCLSMDCLVLHFRHLDGRAFKGGGGPEGMRLGTASVSNLSASLRPAQRWICYKKKPPFEQSAAAQETTCAVYRIVA